MLGNPNFFIAWRSSHNDGWLAISGGHIFNGQELYIHAWAYESDPGKGLFAGQIPEPGSSLLLVMGALLLGTRGRASSGNRL